MKTRYYSSLAMLLLALFVFLNSGAGIQAQTLVQSPPKEPTTCAAFTAVQQQEFDVLTASKDAGTLTDADMARYDALAQQLNCYNAQFAAAAQPEQTRGALPAAPLAAGVCDAVPAGPIEVEGTLTGTTPTAYATLGEAFTAVNNGTHTGDISIDVCGDTNEGDTTATLNANGSGLASYTSITITPAGGAARTISGARAGGNPMIDLNGADNVTINGLNTGGNSLTIANTTVSNSSGTATIRFIGGATNNTITNANIQGSGTMSVATNGAVIFFSTDTVTANGNDNNTISNNNIGPAGANLPTKAILGNGSLTTTAIGNSGIVINNNNIFDYFGATVTSSGIATNGGCNSWTITNNRFYQTGTRTWTTGAIHRAIDIGNSSTTSGAQGFTITGNIIGYASNTQTGTYTLTGSTGKFQGIYFNGITGGTLSDISSNTVASVSLSGVTSNGTSTSSPFLGILVQNGVANTNNNTIGSQLTTGSLTFSTNSTTSTDVHGIYNFSVNNWTATGNNIGGISVTNAAASGTYIVYGLRANTGTPYSFTGGSNNVGGTVANSIQLSATGTSSQVIGMHTSNAQALFTANTIRNLTTNIGTGTTTGASVIGINVTTSTPNHTLSQNTTYNLSNTNATAASVVTGIQFTGSTANVVQRNLIYGLTVATTSATAEVNGIRVAGGTTTYRNNMITLGEGIANAIGGAATNSSTVGIVGINEALGTNQFFHNSVYIGGTATAGSGSSYAFNGVQTVNTRSFRDNIFFNARTNSGATGAHYAIKINGTVPNPGGLTINNNVYFANGSGAVFGFFNSLGVANLAAWQAAVGQDANSIEADPQYNDPTNATPDLHLHPTNPTAAEGNGVDVGVTDDFDGQTRSTLTPVDIGADAGNFTSPPVLTPPNCAIAPSPANAATNVMHTTNLTWNSGGGSPTGYRIYFGTNGGGLSDPTNIANNVDLGLVTTYDPASNLAFATAHYWKIIPYNANGDATGCSIWSFTTKDAPISTFPYTESFETGAGGWTAGGTSSTWELGMPADTTINSAYDGTQAWTTGLTTDYVNSENSYVTSPDFDFSALTNPYLYLAVWWEAEYSYDGANLQYSTNDGASWTTLGAAGDPNNWYNDSTISGLSWSGNQSGWTGRVDTSNGSTSWLVASHSLSMLIGQPNVRFRVAFGADSSTIDDGFAFDYVRIVDVCPNAWDGDTNTDWNNTANWSCNTLPGTTDDVTIPAGTPNNPVISVLDVTLNSLTISNGAQVTLNGKNLTVGTLAINGTLAVAGTETLTVNGTGTTAWTRTGTFTPGSGTVVIGGTGTLTLNLAETFHNLTVATGKTLAGSANTLTVNGAFTNNGTFTPGTELVTGSVFNGTTVNDGTWNTTTGVLTFNGAFTNNATRTFNASSNNTLGTTFNGLMTNNGTFNAQTLGMLFVKGDWANNSTFTANGGTVHFNGNTPQTLSGSTTFNNLTINNAAGVSASGSTLVVTNYLTIMAGTFTSSSTYNHVIVDAGATLASDSSPINVSGDWTNNGTFTLSNGAIHFTGTTAMSGSGVSSFFDIFMDAGATLNAGSHNFSVAGNFTNSGTFNPGTGTVTFNGIGAQHILILQWNPVRATDSFETWTAGVTAVPDGWTEMDTTGTSGDWERGDQTPNPAGGATPPTGGGSYTASFNSYNAGNGDATRLSANTPFDLTGYSQCRVHFWMYHETGYSTANDRLQVEGSIDGTTFADVGAAVDRYDGTTGWKEHFVDFSAYAGQPTVYLGLEGISGYGNDLFIDLVTVECAAFTGSSTFNNIVIGFSGRPPGITSTLTPGGDLTVNGNLTSNPGNLLEMGTHSLWVLGTGNATSPQQNMLVSGVWYYHLGMNGVWIDLVDAGLPLGQTSVTINDRTSGSCVTGGQLTAYRCYQINPETATGRNATVRFYFDATTDLPAGLACTDLRVYHYDGGGAWSLAGNAGGMPTCAGANSYVEVTGVTTFSAFALAGTDVPTAVSLQSLTAAQTNPTGLVWLFGILITGAGAAWLLRRRLSAL